MSKFSRTELLLGKKNMELLKNSSVVIFGLGGVGSYVAESLVRSGIYNFILVDHDKISESNINRQICANINTIGELKTHAMKNRMLEINPDAKILLINQFVNQENISEIINQDKKISYIVDAIDNISAKIQIIISAQKLNIPIISSMGTGNKINPLLLTIDDIYKTKYCPLAKIMRHELKKYGVKKLRVCYSPEQPKKIINHDLNNNSRKKIIASVSFVTATAGLIIASEVVRNILNLNT